MSKLENKIGENPALRILLARPRGFCAGVVRAVEIARRALKLYGAPIYIRHEIVHNKRVVEELRREGAVFIDEVEEAPEGARVIFSAHGVAPNVRGEAQGRDLAVIDATCPLVSKVHAEIRRHHAAGRHVLLIGHRGHPEVIGSMGQVPQGACTLIETAADAENINLSGALAYATQTTLSVRATAEIIAILRRRFPDIAAPRKEDICYATTNRQEAVEKLANQCDLFWIIGAPSSSNACRLVETARTAGCENAKLIESAADIRPETLKEGMVIGISAGASAPEAIIEEVIAACGKHFALAIEEHEGVREVMHFNLPPMPPSMPARA